MKKKYLLVVLLSLSFLLPSLLMNNETNKEKTFAITFNYIKSSVSLPSFGVEIDEENTNDTVIVSLGQSFNFAFFFNVSIASPFGLSSPGVYGGGFQPENWWNDKEHEMRIVGGINVFIDDLDFGVSNIDISNVEDTNQSYVVELEPGIHYLTVIAAEYQLPYEGAPSEEAELVWAKDQHVFYVLENEDDTLPEFPNESSLQLNTEGTPYFEDFSSINLRYKEPRVYFDYIENIETVTPTLYYEYNVSTDGTFHVVEGSSPIDFDKVGTGEVSWWVNNGSLASSPQSLLFGTNYVFICAASVRPSNYQLYSYDVVYPILDFDTIIVQMEVLDSDVIYTEVTETVTSTSYETITETETVYTETVTETITEDNAEASFSMFILPFALLGLSAISNYLKRKGKVN